MPDSISRRVFVIEHRLVDPYMLKHFPAWGEWQRYGSYQTEQERDRALHVHSKTKIRKWEFRNKP